MSGGLVLGIDLGTQSAKALVLDPQSGSIVGRGAGALEILPPEEPGDARQHPDAWAEAITLAVRGALADLDPGSIRAIGVSGQQHGCVTVDAEGRPTGDARLWCDTATVGEAEHLSRELGQAVPVGFTASKIRRIVDRETDRWSRTSKVLLPAGWLGFWLTGRATIDAGDASGTVLLDVAKRTWDEAAVLATGGEELTTRLPDLVPPHAAIGALSTRAAETLGLLAGIPVAPGSGDNMMSAVGSGCVVPGPATLSLGTSGTIFTRRDEPLIDPQGAIAPFCDALGGWLPLLCVMNLTAVYGATSHLVGFEDLDAATDAAARIPIGSEGLAMLPYLQGERVPPLPEARGSIHGLTHANATPAHLFRAALEGTVFNLAVGFEGLRALGVTPSEVRLAGGAARNPLLRRMLAGGLGLRVVRLVEAESAALGAALTAAWSLGSPEQDALNALVGRSVKLESEADDPDPAELGAWTEAAARWRAALASEHGLGR